jgi:hypothetical protein
MNRALVFAAGWILAAALALLFTACSDGDPAAPRHANNVEIPTAAAAVDSFMAGLARLDSLVLNGCLAPSFRFDTGRNRHYAGCDSLGREQVMEALCNLCNTGPAASCTVSQIQAYYYPQDEWTVAGENSPFPGMLLNRVEVHIDVMREGACLDLSTQGLLLFYVIPVGEGWSHRSRYRIGGISDETWGSPKISETGVYSDSFVELLEAFLPAGLPRASLAPEKASGLTGQNFALDASGSWCSGLGLPPAPYRWRVGEEEVWTDWSGDPVLDLSLATTGYHTVTVEVRNAVGWTSRAEARLYVHAADPASVDEVLDLFAYGHNSRDPLPVILSLAPDFRFMFAAEDIAAYDLPAEGLDKRGMVQAVGRLLAEFPPAGLPAIMDLWCHWSGLSQDPPPGRHEESLGIQVTAICLDAPQLQVSGPVDVTLAPAVESVPGEGDREVWYIERIEDRTIESVGGYHSCISWGSLLARFR